MMRTRELQDGPQVIERRRVYAKRAYLGTQVVPMTPALAEEIAASRWMVKHVAVLERAMSMPQKVNRI